MSRGKVLLVGDAVVATGFSKMNHAYADGLKAAGYEVSILALNYHGDPHTYPYDIYPCRTLLGGDAFGVQRLPSLIKQLRPDVVCLTQDPWNVPEYLKGCGDVPVVLSVAVDGKNCRGSDLNGAAHSVFWTEFGKREATLGGYVGEASVIPLGVDLQTYSPMNRADARRAVGLPVPSGAFVVGVVGRNQPRKRLDLTMIYFAEWVKTRGIYDAYLLMHVAPTGDAGYDLKQLGRYLGLEKRCLLSEPPIGLGSSEEALRRVYCSMDVMLTTTQGEGWGLCQMEAMACGVPVIAPDWAALGDWPRDAIRKIPCSSVACTPNNVNAIGGIPDKDATLAALDDLYHYPGQRVVLSSAGLAEVGKPWYRWSHVGSAFADIVTKVLVDHLALRECCGDVEKRDHVCG